MASTKMKIKKSKSGGYEVMVLAKHPMETGLRKDKKTGNKIPEHFIENMEFAVNGEVVAQANLGTGVSKNPLIGVGIPNAKPGDTAVSYTHLRAPRDLSTSRMPSSA